MSKLKIINQYRRNLMRGLTKNVGSAHLDRAFDPNVKVDIKRVLISRPNDRLGNLLLITPLMQDVVDAFPDCKIDLFVRGGLSPILFESYPNVNLIMQLPRKPFKDLYKYMKSWMSLKKYNYDLVINVDQNSSSGRLSCQFANSKFKVFGDVNAEITSKDQEHIAKYAVHNFRKYLEKLGIDRSDKPMPFLDLKLSDAELAEGKEIMASIADKSKPTISLFTYATGAKCYPESWWMPFFERLKIEFPDYNFIEILPKENVSQIGFAVPTYYSTEIRKIGAVMANSAVFIGADSGMMHLASAALAPTVGLFHVTSMTKYVPYNPGSVGIDTNQSSMEDWISVIDVSLKASRV